MNWNEYVIRRRIDGSKWLASKGLSTREQFLAKLVEIEVDPPAEDQLVIMFPPEVKNEPTVLSPEGIDSSTARSVVNEGDGSDLRSNGKRSSKVPVR
jgi:hypothetical protein